MKRHKIGLKHWSDHSTVDALKITKGGDVNHDTPVKISPIEWRAKRKSSLRNQNNHS